MPRKKNIYSSEFPYHIYGRSNNKEWFSVDSQICWYVFCENLSAVSNKYGFMIHAFVLMSNHYHLMATCSDEYNLGQVMNWFCSNTSRNINSRSGRINHVFGGPYKGSLITNEYHFANVMKYVFQNPIKAGICQRVEEYPFSSVSSFVFSSGRSAEHLPISSYRPFSSALNKNPNELFDWLNTRLEEPENERIRSALNRPKFEFFANRRSKKMTWMNSNSIKIDSPPDQKSVRT